ncbi:MAG: thioredoxin domain-containing protein [Vampirovibrionales bacterium]
MWIFGRPGVARAKPLPPLSEELASDYSGKLKVVKINTDDNFKTAQEYRISGIPSLLIFKNGEPVGANGWRTQEIHAGRHD